MFSGVTPFEWLSLIVSVISVVFAMIVFLINGIQAKHATEEQTHIDTVRATLTDFSILRRNHQDFVIKIKANPENREEYEKAYIGDLERFATGYNMGAYDLEVVNRMSGGMIINQYRAYFRSYVSERRRAASSKSAIRKSDLYAEYLKMMKDLYKMRGEEWENIEELSADAAALEKFLKLPIDSPDSVFARFRELPGAIEHQGEGKEHFLYIPGTREDRCVLAAHADTVADTFYTNEAAATFPVLRDGKFISGHAGTILGADDRAGCAILWQLRKSGHSLLILDGEEHGQIGANYLRNSYPELWQEIEAHSFLLQLDRRGERDYKTYSIPVSREFHTYIQEETGFKYNESSGKTDICALCEHVCGVNLSIGYYEEHTKGECLQIDQWEHTLQVVRTMVEKPLKRFPTEHM